mmetsp:Transcript_11634/g.25157  ORF Transcript_11634/g.25157 Transcript_11634/m.25157 type:complete len:231 (-) Transcript_11634:332-1024(-)
MPQNASCSTSEISSSTEATASSSSTTDTRALQQEQQERGRRRNTLITRACALCVLCGAQNNTRHENQLCALKAIAFFLSFSLALSCFLFLEVVQELGEFCKRRALGWVWLSARGHGVLELLRARRRTVHLITKVRAERENLLEIHLRVAACGVGQAEQHGVHACEILPEPVFIHGAVVVHSIAPFIRRTTQQCFRVSAGQLRHAAPTAITVAGGGGGNAGEEWSLRDVRG